MSDTTLIQRLREDLPKVNEPESQFVCVATPDIRQAADALEQQAAQDAINRSNIDRLAGIVNQQADEIEQQAAQIEALQLTKAGLIGSLREEMDEGLRLRELGGALPDENITAMTERLIGERAALAAELSALRADAERYRWLCRNNFDREKMQVHTWIQTWEPHSQTGEPIQWTQRVRGGAYLSEVIDAALRQEQPT